MGDQSADLPQPGEADLEELSASGITPSTAEPIPGLKEGYAKELGDFEAFVKDEPIGSTTFNAFTDFVDLLYAKHRVEADSGNTEHVLSRALIRETIRQRRNGLPGYHEAEIRLEKLYLDVRKAASRSYQKTYGSSENTSVNAAYLVMDGLGVILSTHLNVATPTGPTTPPTQPAPAV